MAKGNYKKIKTIREMLELAVSETPEHIAFEYKEKGNIVKVTTTEFYESVLALGASLCKKGFGKSHIACVGPNSYKWIQVFYTVLMSEGVFVPLDKELEIENIVYLINESKSEVVFCSAHYEEALYELKAQMPGVKAFVCFDREADSDNRLSFSKMIKEGEKLDKKDYNSAKIVDNELKYLVYTSGTTGVAKGVMLSNHNITAGIYYGLKVSSISGKGLSVLPYNHTYEAVCDILVSMHARVTLCINDSLKNVQKNLVLFKPDYIYLVPAFSEHFYKLIWSNAAKQGKEKTLKTTIKLSNALRKIGIDLRRVIFSSILKSFGGRLRRIVCGGAPIRPETGKFFDEIGISLTGGYGITECSPLISVNDDDDNSFDSAGSRLECLEWRIDSPGEGGIGEICVKGDVVMLGYYGRPDLTAEVIRDGWFYTGDYGFINKNDKVVITGRKKNIIVLTNGKNIYPEEIELKISEVRYITECVVSGIKNEHGQDTGLKAEVYIDGEYNPVQAEKDIKDSLSKLPNYKQIAEVKFRSEAFEKTTTNKIKRKS